MAVRDDLGDQAAVYLRHPHLLAFAAAGREGSGGALESEPYAAEWAELAVQPVAAVLLAALQIVAAISYLGECGCRFLALSSEDAVVDAAGGVRLWTPGALVPRQHPELDAEDLGGVWTLCAPLLDRGGRRRLRELLARIAAGDPLGSIYARLRAEDMHVVLSRTPRSAPARPSSLAMRGVRSVQGARRRMSALDSALERVEHELEKQSQARRTASPKSRGPIVVAVVLVAVAAVAAVVVPFPGQ